MADSSGAGNQSAWSALYRREDWWAVWLGLGIVLVAILFLKSGSTLQPLAVAPPKWAALGTLIEHYAASWGWYLVLYLVFGVLFVVSGAVMGLHVGEYAAGYTVVFAASAAILALSRSAFASDYNLEAPLLALIVGLAAGNLIRLPVWLDTSLRTEYYIKTGIVLLGATLPLSVILQSGPLAFLQATIVSVTTWLIIYWTATRVFKLDPRFGAVLGAAGSVCGVSASIAVGASVKARKEYIAIAISVVTIWAIVMIFFLPFASHLLELPSAVAGAWIGTSEFADAAGFAAASAIGGEAPIQAFTLMKVIGRDIWIGIWCFVLSIIAVVVWERRAGGEGGAGPAVIWERFPKFVLGFLAASILMSLVAAGYAKEAYDELVTPHLIAPIKTLRTWTFVFTFLCIGLTTRFRELTRFGSPPFWAFTIGVGINVILGYWLSSHVFREYWMQLMEAVP
ncbi:MAG: putative sulfate exporter family transporter [Acidobacteriota bacterium]